MPDVTDPRKLCEEIFGHDETVTPEPWEVVELSPATVKTADGRISVSWSSTDGVETAKAERAAALIAHYRSSAPELARAYLELEGKLEKAHRLIALASSVLSEERVNEEANCHAVFATFVEERAAYFALLSEGGQP